jgi:spore coat polysaccharide biosynthesis protein SpsF
MIEPAIGIIQARVSSSRLPGKVLKPLAGYPMIWHIYKRAEQCRFVNKVIVATSTDETDDPLVDFCKQNQMEVFRGSLTNVLDRYIQVLLANPYKYFVRITGDCPLIHPDFIDNQINALNKFKGDAVWIQNPGSLFEGQGVQSTNSLFHIARNSKDTRDMEHVGSEYMSTNPHQFKFVQLDLPENLVIENIRLTVDEENDYLFFNKIYNGLWDNQPIDLMDVIAFLDNNPDVRNINQEIQHRPYNLEVQEKRKNKPPNLIGTYKYLS